MKPTETIKQITIPNFIQTDTKDYYLDITVDYTIDEYDYGIPYLKVDTIWLQGGNITELLSASALTQIENEAEALIKGTTA